MLEPSQELEFYRHQLNELGARVLRLHYEQTQAKREARRARTMAVVMHDVYRLSRADVPLDEVAVQVLRILLDRLRADRAALVERRPGQAHFRVMKQLGFAGDDIELPDVTPTPEFFFVNSATASDARFAALRKAVGTPFMLWVYNERLQVALVLGNETEDQRFHLPFDEGDREIAVGALSVFADIVERRQAEEEQRRLEARVQQAQRLESLGVLAGGIAHDFNNLLGSMLGFADVGLRTIPQDNPAHRHVRRAIEIGMRAKDLVSQVLVFGQRGELEQKAVGVRSVVREAVRLMQPTLPPAIQVQCEFRGSNDVVLANPTHLHQVAANLCMNAVHAMRDTGGTLTVTVAEEEVDDAFAEQYPNLKPGRYVTLAVKDTGHGMDAGLQERIFEPFFTTKGPRQGSGMGLPIVHGIASSHGGIVTVESSPGQGSEFVVYLPQFERGTPAEAPLQDTAPPGGSERVLLVEDEPDMADMAKMMLEGLGYAVTAESDALAALDRFRAEPAAFDLVITDHSMPAMTGEAFAQALTHVRPDLPVILMTGYAASLTPEAAARSGIRETLTKPVLSQELAQAVRHALGGEAANQISRET